MFSTHPFVSFRRELILEQRQAVGVATGWVEFNLSL